MELILLRIIGSGKATSYAKEIVKTPWEVGKKSKKEEDFGHEF